MRHTKDFKTDTCPNLFFFKRLIVVGKVFDPKQLIPCTEVLNDKGGTIQRAGCMISEC